MNLKPCWMECSLVWRFQLCRDTWSCALFGFSKDKESQNFLFSVEYQFCWWIDKLSHWWRACLPSVQKSSKWEHSMLRETKSRPSTWSFWSVLKVIRKWIAQSGIVCAIWRWPSWLGYSGRSGWPAGYVGSDPRVRYRGMSTSAVNIVGTRKRLAVAQRCALTIRMRILLKCQPDTNFGVIDLDPVRNTDHSVGRTLMLSVSVGLKLLLCCAPKEESPRSSFSSFVCEPHQ